MNRYERLNEERKIIEKESVWLRIAVFPRIMKTKRIHLKASNAISSNISSATQIGSCMRFLPMKAFLERAQKSVKSLTE